MMVVCKGSYKLLQYILNSECPTVFTRKPLIFSTRFEDQI